MSLMDNTVYLSNLIVHCRFTINRNTIKIIDIYIVKANLGTCNTSLTYFNDGGGGGGVQSDFFGSKILAKSDFFGSMKMLGFFWVT